jgi:hypothetical protein
MTRDARAVPPLLEAGPSPFTAFFGMAVENALMEIATVGIPSLVDELTTGQKGAREMAARILYRLNWKPCRPDQHAWYAVALGHFCEAARLGESAVEPLVSTLRKKGGFSNELDNAFRVLGQTGAQAADSLISLLSHVKDPIDLMRISRALRSFGDARGIAPLTNVLRRITEVGLDEFDHAHAIRCDVGDLLKQNMNSVSEDLLNEMASLPDLQLKTTRPMWDGKRERTESLSILRELARHELNRRTTSST